jgi:hypothetical protein
MASVTRPPYSRRDQVPAGSSLPNQWLELGGLKEFVRSIVYGPTT